MPVASERRRFEGAGGDGSKAAPKVFGAWKFFPYLEPGFTLEHAHRDSYPTGQGSHLTGSGHAKPVLNEVKNQV